MYKEKITLENQKKTTNPWVFESFSPYALIPHQQKRTKG